MSDLYPIDKTVAKQFAVQMATAGQILKGTLRKQGLYYLLTVQGPNRGGIIYKEEQKSDGHLPLHIGFWPRPTKPQVVYIVTIQFIWYSWNFTVRTSRVELHKLTKPYRARNERIVKKLHIRLLKLVSQEQLELRWSRNKKSLHKYIRQSPELHDWPMIDYYQSAGNIVYNNVVQRRKWDRTWTGVRTTGFASLAKRNRPINSHSVYIQRWWDGSFTEVWNSTILANQALQFSPCKDAQQRGLCGAEPSVANHIATAYSHALSKLKSKAELNVNNVAQDIYELKQLERMVVKTTARLVGAVKAVRSFRFDHAAKELWGSGPARFRRFGHPDRGKTLAENWLEFQYGWKPLLQDVVGAAEGLAKMNIGNSEVQEVSAVSNREFVVRDNILGPAQKPIIGFRVEKTQTKCKIVLRYKVDSHLLAFMTQTGFTNPVNLAWEVLPFSFVVDWFIPIGEYCEGLTSFMGLAFLDGYKTQFTRVNTYYDVSWAGHLDGTPASSSKRYVGNMACESIRLTRDKLTAFPSNDRPMFKNPFSMTHTLNALALLRTTFLGASRLRA